MYADAKTALERKDRDTAITGFQRLLRAIDSAPAMKGELADLRVLADGFLTLSRALPEPPAASTPDPGASSAPTPDPAEGAPIVASSTRPVAISQEIPPWITYDDASRRVGFSGNVARSRRRRRQGPVGGDGSGGAPGVRQSAPKGRGIMAVSACNPERCGGAR